MNKENQTFNRNVQFPFYSLCTKKMRCFLHIHTDIICDKTKDRKEIAAKRRQYI